MYYIAYGSNLNKEEMKRRCKDAKFVSLARLENYTLTYRGPDAHRRKAPVVFAAASTAYAVHVRRCR